MEMMKEAELWVGVGVVIFLGLLAFLKVPRAAARALDDRSATIKAALDEATALRDEARTLLDSLTTRREDAERQAGRMIAAAQAQAAQLEADAQARLAEQVARRSALADRRIAAAEAEAAAEVKAAAADLAVQLAGSMLAARVEGLTHDPLVDRAIPQIGPRLQ